MFSRMLVQRLYVASCVLCNQNAARPNSLSSTSSADSGVSLSSSSFSSPAAHTRALPSKLSARMHGTVTAFKHRRGYGFVLAEGFVAKAGAANNNNNTSTTTTTQPSSAATTSSSCSSVNSSSSPSLNQRSDAEATLNNALDNESGVAQIGRSYFFSRSALNEGFYLTEGERVSFNVIAIAPRRASHEHALRQGNGPDANSSHRDKKDKDTKAIRIRMYDPRTGQESLVLPIMLQGKVIQWDVIRGQGVIAELDMEKNLHPDSPRFSFGLENLALPESATVSVDRYVRFCMLPSDAADDSAGEDAADEAKRRRSNSNTTEKTAADERLIEGGDAAAAHNGKAGLPVSMRVADRIIFDRDTESEKRVDVLSSQGEHRGARKGFATRGNNTSMNNNNSTTNTDSDYTSDRKTSSHAAPSNLPITDESGQPIVFTGVVREQTESGYGFVIDDYTGKSLFFHKSQSATDVRPGEHVMYNKLDIVMGKHAGKVSCVNLRPIDHAAASSSHARATNTVNDELFSETDINDFDLLD